MKDRVESVDVFRGLTIAVMILVNTPGDWGAVYAPLLHAEWHGYTPTDLVFPFFLYIVGISIAFVYSVKKISPTAYLKIVTRSLKLLGLGLFLNLFLPYFPFIKELSTVRLPGILQRIGVVFFFTAILSMHCAWKQLLGIAITILVGYWVLLDFIALPDGTSPTLDRAPNNWANYVDMLVLKSHTWKPDYDPEGVLSTIPAIATALIGVLIGKVILYQHYMKAVLLCCLGLAMIAIGYIWNNWFPFNKALWSSSFVLVTAGWASLVLGVLYYAIDVKKKRLGTSFKYVGSNAIVIYVASSFISKTFYLLSIGDMSIHGWLYSTLFTPVIAVPKLASLMYAVVVVLCYMLLGYVLYRKKIFIKV